MKKISIVLSMTLLLALASFSPAYAAFEWPVAEWNIPFIGTMKTPDGFSAVEVQDFRSFVEQEKKSLTEASKLKKDKAKTSQGNKTLPGVPDGTPTILTETLPTDPAAAEKRFLKSELALYHLSMDDGEAIHTAWFLIARDGDKIPANADVFHSELTPEQTQKLDELKKWLDDNLPKAQYTDAKNKVSMKLLQILPIQPLAREQGKLWTTAGRAMITVEGMPFAFFARIYALSIDNKLAVGVLGGFDGERPFWDPVIRDMILGLRENPVTQ